MVNNPAFDWNKFNSEFNSNLDAKYLPKLKQNKVIITGENGFIGKQLSNLLKKDSNILVYPISHNLLVPLQRYALSKRLHEINPDYIFHLAAYGNHSEQQDDTEMIGANVINLFNLLNESKDIPYKAFINFGSSSEYGQKDTWMNELDLPEPINMYGCTKLCGTYLARAFAKKYTKPIVTVRPFSVFGEDEAEHRFIPTVIRKLLLDEEITLDADAKHDWIYLADFLDALGLITDKAELLSGQVVNIGTGKEYSNLQVVEMLEIISRKKAKIKRVEGLRPDDSKTWRADISKLKSLEWRPKTIVSAGLYRTYQYYKNKYYGN